MMVALSISLSTLVLLLYAIWCVCAAGAGVRSHRRSSIARTKVVERFGRRVRLVLGRVRLHVPPERDAAVGWIALASSCSLLIDLKLALGVAVAGMFGMVLRDRRMEQHRQRQMERTAFLCINLFVVALGNGCNLRGALEAVGKHCPGPLGEELLLASGHTYNGKSVVESLGLLRERVPLSIRPFVSTLLAGERYGAPLSEVLDRLADQSRAEQRRHAEHAAKRLSVLLLFPLAVCTLPAFALLTLAPIIASALGVLASKS